MFNEVGSYIVSFQRLFRNPIVYKSYTVVVIKIVSKPIRLACNPVYAGFVVVI